MTYEYTGKITWVGESEECTGKIKRKVAVVVHCDDGRDMYMWIFDDNIEKFLNPLDMNDKVTGSFSVKSTQYGQKWYTNIYCLTMEKVEPRQKRSHRGPGRDRGNQSSYYSYFSNCGSAEEIKKRYRQLCKMYHPDTGNGNEKIMQEVNQQYSKLK